MRPEIKPPAGYRELRAGEIIRGDDVLIRLNGEITPRRDFLSASVGVLYEPSVHAPTYRKLETPAIDAGYRLLAPTEVIEEGDEYYSILVNKWCPSRAVGQTPAEISSLIEENIVYRREITQPATRNPEPRVYAGDGYRFLDVGEILQAGDEILYPDAGGNCSVGSADPIAGQVINATPPYPRGYYRRKIGVPELIGTAPSESCSAEPAKIDPGAGYRLLAPTEVIREGDEVYDDYHGEWVATSRPGSTPAYEALDYRRKAPDPFAKVTVTQHADPTIRVSLELTRREAEALLDLTCRIGGGADVTPRGVTDKLMDALRGFALPEHDGPGTSPFWDFHKDSVYGKSWEAAK